MDDDNDDQNNYNTNHHCSDIHVDFSSNQQRGQIVDDDDEVFYDIPTPTPSQSQFDIELSTEAAAYDEEREYDDLELFYEEQTFARVGGSMLLGQAAELMTVPEYDEEAESDEDSECAGSD